MSVSLPIASTHFDSALDDGPTYMTNRIYTARYPGRPSQSNRTVYLECRWNGLRSSIGCLAQVDKSTERFSYLREIDYSALAQKEVREETFKHCFLPLYVSGYMFTGVINR